MNILALIPIAWLVTASAYSSAADRTAEPSAPGHASGPSIVRIGFQKYGTLILLKARGTLESRLSPLGTAVEWAEFSYGPPMLEALNANHLDFAGSGETPPVFARAARGSELVYVGYEAPSPAGEAVIVAKNSAIRTVAELKGRRIAVARGSNAHYLLTRALLAAGLADGQVEQVDLTPADARAAFQTGAVDAWAIWDFHLAAAEHALGARILVDGRNLVNNSEIYSARGEFARRHPDLIGAVLEEIAKTDAWAKDHVALAAALLDAHLHVGVPVLETALSRRGYGVRPADRELALAQQTIADTLYYSGILPHSVQIGDALWTAETRP